MSQLQNPYQAVVQGDFIHVRFPKFNKDILTKVRLIPNRRWDDKGNFWSLKISIDSIYFVIHNNFHIPPAQLVFISEKLDVLIKKAQLKSRRFAMSKAIEAEPIEHIAKKMRLPAWPYQWGPVHYAEMTEGQFFIGDEMALGKSVESLMVVNHEKYENMPVGIVTKTPETYQKELFKFFGEQSIILNGPLTQLHPKIRYYISSYDRMKFFFEAPDMAEPVPRAYCKDMFWIYDEAHLIKNTNTKRHKLAKEILKRCEKKILMSGTPLPNKPEEIFQLLNLMFPKFMSKSAFMAQFCGEKWTDKGKEVTSDTNYQTLKKWLFENVFIRRLKSQVQAQLPEKIRESQFIKDKPVAIHAESMLELFAKSARLKAKDKDFQTWLEIVLEETGDSKVGIFVHHKCMADAVEEMCVRNGYGYVKIDGSTAPESRQALADRFASDPSKKVAILGMQVAGTGLNGLQAANFCIFTELTWVPGNMLQCEDRFHRPGLKSALTILYAVYSEFEMELSDRLLRKLGVIQRIIGHEDISDDIKEESLMASLAAKFGLPLGRAA